MASYQLQFKTHQGSPFPTVKLDWFSNGTEPVIILRPNLDADMRKLPSKVEDKDPVAYDYDKGYGTFTTAFQVRDFEATARSRTDDEIVAIHIVPLNPQQPTNPKEIKLRIQSPACLGLRFSYSDGNATISPSGYLPQYFNLDLSKISKPLHLEAISLMGILPESNTDPDKITVADKIDFGMPWRIELLVDGEVEDAKAAMIAPWLIPSNMEEPERIFVSETTFQQTKPTQNANSATVNDLKLALQSKGQDFVTVVPPKQNKDDLWHQDQTQVGVCNAPNGSTTIMLHLPRHGGNVDGDPEQGNLSNFIDGFFPSTNVGVFNALRNKVIKGQDIDGKGFELTTLQASRFDFLIGIAFDVQVALVHFANQKKANASTKFKTQEVFTNLQMLAEDLPELYEEELKTPTALTQQLRRFIGVAKDLGQFIVWHPAGADGEVDSVDVRVRQVWENTVSEVEFDRISSLVSKLNNALNYGGNIEVSPSTDLAPFGKIIVGTSLDGNRVMSPLLLSLLDAQSWQPVVEIDTEWLAVGHVDELLAFSPAPALTAKSAMLYADPQLALKILRAASDLWESGRAGNNMRTDAPSVTPEPLIHLPRTHRNRFTSIGDHPMTMMMRGKFWFESRSAQKKSGPRNTSKVHLKLMKMLQEDGKGILSDLGLEFTFRSADAEFYGAKVNVNELLTIAEMGNEFVANGVLAQNLDILKKALPNALILPIPVLFDLAVETVDMIQADMDAKANNAVFRWPQRVDAFSPNMANIQTVGNQLLVPKPFGPRMKAEDALMVIKTVLSEGNSPAKSTLGPHLIRQNALDKVTIWLEAPLGNERGRGLRSDLEIIAREFEDFFKDNADAQTQIRKSNPGKFGADDNFIKDGVQQLVIPENTVDLFELYMAALASAMGVKISFIDTWFYHVRKGGIHCGTNWIPKVEKSHYEWWKFKPPGLRTLTDQL
ncbi:MAG: protein-arginine deiminase family protein [Bacteroidia bacterium]